MNVQDVSVNTEISYKLFKRMMPVTQTLSIMLVQIWHYVEVDNSQGTETENEYKTNLLSLRELQLSQERHWDSEDMISVVIFSAALENQKASLFMQWPEMLVFQNESTGMHTNTDPRMVQQP